MDTPSKQLAQKIIDRLISEQLISAEDGKKMLVKLPEGKLRPEDWRLPLELATEQKAKS